MNVFQVTTNFRELLDLFSNLKELENSLDEYFCNQDNEILRDNSKEIRELADELNVDEEVLFDIFQEKIIFPYSIDELLLEAIEDFIKYKIADCCDVGINLERDNDTVTATIKTTKSLDQIIAEGMDAYGDWDYWKHDETDRENLKSDFYFILKYLIYYYVACNGGPVKPSLKIERDLDNCWEYPGMHKFEKICKELLEQGSIKEKE